MAIANAEAKEALTASRARIIAAADEGRRQIERDLHDGAQQGLVSLALHLQAARASVPADADALAGQLDRAVTMLTVVLDELSEIAHGVHPTVLSQSGLRPALKGLARRSAVPVQLDIRAERRLPEHVELCAYYVIAEALTNTAKHAAASEVHVNVVADDEMLRIEVRHVEIPRGADRRPAPAHRGDALAQQGARRRSVAGRPAGDDAGARALLGERLRLRQARGEAERAARSSRPRSTGSTSTSST